MQKFGRKDLGSKNSNLTTKAVSSHWQFPRHVWSRDWSRGQNGLKNTVFSLIFQLLTPVYLPPYNGVRQNNSPFSDSLLLSFSYSLFYLEQVFVLLLLQPVEILFDLPLSSKIYGIKLLIKLLQQFFILSNPLLIPFRNSRRL